MFAPHILLSSWGVGLSSSAGFVGRRAAALFTGIGVMFFLARNAEPSTARSALVGGLLVACSVLVALGLFELASGYANANILSAVFVEGAIVLAFLYVGKSTVFGETPTNVAKLNKQSRRKL
jgi:FtsH-binding integral membrane protein